MSNVHKDFSTGVDTLAQAQQEGITLVQTSEDETDNWLTTRTMLEVGMVPLLRDWLTRFQTAVKPFSLRTLYAQHHWLRRYTGVTWWQPRAFGYRLQIGRLWFLIQYERTRAWVLKLYRRVLAWCIRYRRILIGIALAIVLAVALYYWLQLMGFIWRNVSDAVRAFWQERFDS